MKKGIIVLLVWLSTPVLAVDVYKCTTETGTISYQQTPCRGNQPTMLESKGIVDRESYQQAMKMQSGKLGKYQVNMLVFKWWKGFRNEVSDEFLHFKFTDDSGDTDISLLIDFIDSEQIKKMDQLAVKNMVIEKGKTFERVSVLGKTSLKTMKLNDGYGYYASYKDASLVGKTSYPAGEYLNTTQGLLKKGDLLVNFTLLSNDTSAENHLFALQFLANGIFIEEVTQEAVVEASLLDRAYIEYHDGSKLKALELFEELVKREPDEFKSWIGYCLALRDNNRLQMALVACDRALGFKPNDPDVLNSVMNILIKGREYNKALELAKNLVQISVKPQILDTINNLGFYAMIDGQLEVAKIALEMVKREAGPTRKVMLDLAELDYLEGKKEQAVSSFKSIEKQTQDVGVIRDYYLKPIENNQKIHPPHSNSDSFSDIPSALLNIGDGQLSEAMVKPWVKRYYPIQGVGQLEVKLPEDWLENIQLKKVNEKTKELSLVLVDDTGSLMNVRLDVGKMTGDWSISDMETQMKSSLKLYFEDEPLNLTKLKGDVEGFTYQGITPDEDSNFIHAISYLDGLVAVDVVGLSVDVSSQQRGLLAEIINSVRLTAVDQTILVIEPTKASEESEKTIVERKRKPVNETALPESPDGFSWVRMPKAMAAFLKPDGWFQKNKSTEDAVTYVIAKEDVTKNNYFDTGLTVIAIEDLHKKSGVVPFLLALAMADEIEKDSDNKVLDIEELSQGPFNSFGVKYENHPANMPAIVVHKVFISNDSTGSLYIVNFEAPKDEWDEAWKMGEVMLKKYLIDDEF